jgi:hypothetical protein
LANAGMAALNSRTPASTAIKDFFKEFPPVNAALGAHFVFSTFSILLSTG